MGKDDVPKLDDCHQKKRKQVACATAKAKEHLMQSCIGKKQKQKRATAEDLRDLDRNFLH
jgi:hypothetical protein